MTDILVLLLAIIIFLFGFVLLFGSPYLPTKKEQINIALDLLNLKKGDTLLELGCGDGRVLNAAAKRGVKSVGYELNPIMFLIATILTWKNRSLVSVRLGNYWRVEMPKAQAIFVFLHGDFMKKLDRKIRNQKLFPLKLASFAYQIPGKKADISKKGIYIYIYK